METTFIQHLSRHPALALIKFPSGTTWRGAHSVFVNHKLWEPSPDCEEQRDWWLKANKGMMFSGSSIITSPTPSSDRSTPESPASPTSPHSAFDGHNILAQHCQYDDIFLLDDLDNDDKDDEDFFGFASSTSITCTASLNSKPMPSSLPTQSWADRGPDGVVAGQSLLDPRLFGGDDWSLVQLSPKFSHDVPPIGVRY